MNFEKIELTGSRIVGAITSANHSGPKHHALIIGKHHGSGLVYAAEHNNNGFGYVPLSNFKQKYEDNGDIKVYPNDGSFSDLVVAQRALEELDGGGKGKYNLLTNNCECFVNRAMYNQSISKQVITVAASILICIGGIWYITKNGQRVKV